MKVYSSDDQLLDLQFLEMAWKSIVQQPAVLRRVFVSSTSGKRMFWLVMTEVRQIENGLPESFFAQALEWEKGCIALTG